MTDLKMQRARKYEKNLDMLMSLVTEKGFDPFSREKGSLLYKLEAEEIDVIDLKKLEVHA